MLIEQEGYLYKIIISTTTHGIQPMGYHNGILKISVYHEIPKQELAAYLRINRAQLHKKTDQTIPNKNTWTEISMFGKKYGLRQDPRSQKPYIRTNAILTPLIPQNLKQAEQLKTDLLKDRISECIGLWEDRLDFLLDNIVIRKLRSKDYSISKDRTVITYATKLADVDLPMLSYILGHSIFDYLRLSGEQRTNLSDRYIQEWKHLAKVYDFEKTE